jgi:hypothetical protein
MNNVVKGMKTMGKNTVAASLENKKTSIFPQANA